MEKKKIIIVGMGEHAKICKQIVVCYKTHEFIGFVDDVLAKSCLGTVNNLPALIKKYGNCYIFIAIGRNSVRKSIFQKVKNMKIPFTSIIHPSSVIESTVTLGENIFVGPNAVINNNAIIENGVFINSGVIVEHDNVIGSFSHLAPGVITGGKVIIGENSFVGIGATLVDHISLGNNCLVGAGSVVLESFHTNTLLMGIPARKVEKKTVSMDQYI